MGFFKKEKKKTFKELWNKYKGVKYGVWQLIFTPLAWKK